MSTQEITSTNNLQKLSINYKKDHYTLWQVLGIWLGWFGEAKAHAEVWIDNSQVTTFSNVVMDQAGLVGLIRRLHGREIVLISIRQVEI